MKSIFTILLSLTLLGTMAQQKDSLPQKDTSTFNKTQKLGEVVIQGKKPFIEIQVDKIVLNVQNDIIATGGTLFEVLQKCPGCSFNNN